MGVGYKLVNGLKAEIRALRAEAEEAKARRRQHNRKYYSLHADMRRAYAAKKAREAAEARRAELEAAVARVHALAASGTATAAELALLPRLEKRLRMSDAQRARRQRELVE